MIWAWAVKTSSLIFLPYQFFNRNDVKRKNDSTGSFRPDSSRFVLFRPVSFRLVPSGPTSSRPVSSFPVLSCLVPSRPVSFRSSYISSSYSVVVSSCPVSSRPVSLKLISSEQQTETEQSRETDHTAVPLIAVATVSLVSPISPECPIRVAEIFIFDYYDCISFQLFRWNMKLFAQLAFRNSELILRERCRFDLALAILGRHPTIYFDFGI